MSMIEKVGDVAARYWWVLLVRGIVLVILGIMMFAWPSATVLVVALLFAIYLLIDGVMAIAQGFAERREGGSSGWLFVQGALAIIAGIVVLVWPKESAVAIVILIAIWALIAGIAAIAAGVRLRKEPGSGWGWFLTWGILAVLFGIAMLINPTAGILSLLWLVAIWAIITGVMLAVLSFMVRSAGRSLRAQQGNPA